MTDRPDLPPLDVEVCLSGVRDATAALLDGLRGLTDDEARRPSLLPGWTVGHVLTHLARNAEGVRGMIEGAVRDVAVPMYPSAEARRADIEAGAGRPAAALVDDVAATAEALDASWPAGGAPAWEGSGLTLAGPLPVAEMPFRRWREVEVHRADLGLAFTWADWSDAYVAVELERTVAESAARTPDGHPVAIGPDDDHRLVLAWLLGRAERPDGYPELAPWQAPPPGPR
ncbi:maleylpyruvate isomerase family mycothiol-dependent enzyme [Iamia sp. SCSIO 61187]|uniref:maleylpyruvate isomerase N-terminal domain-containing protein n=1 Tax=Iamia sp. SCSIO 61187 TaxID=2722752 RepID=UPI001C62487C|nr:maleylpyruvate isomerase N-terminal domain-containing protein [Iamia sp. SCSIO 61187]QYG91440.1 maleylpyruvate isomerase family mycothiol-dependent enzyme [Iamia sp. SCSIO 61187]